MRDSCVSIDLEKKFYEPGEFITGEVTLKTRIPFYLTKIILNFTKIREIDICKIQLNTKRPNHNHKEVKTVYSYDFNLYVNSDTISGLSSGKHKFPFRFSLKASDNSSTEIKGVYFDHLVNIKNIYKLTCFILTDSEVPVYEITKEVQVTDKINADKEFKIEVEMSSMLCFYNKAYTIIFKLNKNLFLSGDQLTLDINCFNMKKHIKKVDVSVYEILSVSTEGFNFIRTRFIIGGNAHDTKQGYLVELRIPSTTPSSVTESEFNLKTVLFITINLYKSSPVRIKKYLQVVKKNLEIPQIDHLNVLDGEIFEEKIFVLT